MIDVPPKADNIRIESGILKTCGVSNVGKAFGF
jgi:hypothetical protein